MWKRFVSWFRELLGIQEILEQLNYIREEVYKPPKFVLLELQDNSDLVRKVQVKSLVTPEFSGVTEILDKLNILQEEIISNKVAPKTLPPAEVFKRLDSLQKELADNSNITKRIEAEIQPSLKSFGG